MKIYSEIIKKCEAGKKLLAVLIDPDKTGDEKKTAQFLNKCEQAQVDYLFLGGSLITDGDLDKTLEIIKKHSAIPVILFPGDIIQINKKADALLFLSLISGRNAELLIGKHVAAAPFIRKNNLESISTGYMLVDCGNSTTASYISQTFPIPYDKAEIAVATALAGEMLGMKIIYADGGSGAQKTISEKMISEIKKNISIPLIVGGGIKNYSEAQKIWEAGADLLVIGTAFENNPELIDEFQNRK